MKKQSILFTDIVGYSKLTGQNQSLALELLNEHDKIIEPIIKRYSGIIVKRIGDAIVAIFDDSKHAAQSSVEIQQSLKNRNNRNQKSRQILIRIGIHYGDIIYKNDEIYGKGYEIASQIEPIAEFGGISISEDFFLKSCDKDELIINGVKNNFYVKPVANFILKSSIRPVLVYKLYLNIIDWYDESFNDVSNYLEQQNINQEEYNTINYKDIYKSKNNSHIVKAKEYLELNDLSYAVYHHQMFLFHSNDNNLEFTLKIFAECGLCRLVKNELKKIKYESDVLKLTNGINHFNNKQFDLSKSELDQCLNSSKTDFIKIEALYYLICIYYLEEEYSKIFEIYNSNISLINKPKIHKNYLELIINTIEFQQSKSNNDKEKLLKIIKNFDSLNSSELNLGDKKYSLFLYHILINVSNKYSGIDLALKLQNDATILINECSNAISGFLLKILFKKNPILHQFILTPLEIELFDDEGYDDYDLDDILSEQKEVTIFCPSCGAKNSNKFKFCTSCGEKLIKV